MKKILFLLGFVLASPILLSQEYEVTPNGLRDKDNLENNYLVIEAPDKTAEELYKNALKYVNEIQANPEDAVKGNIENEYIRFNTYVPNFTNVKVNGLKIPISIRHTTELRFKDGKVRYEVLDSYISTNVTNGFEVKFMGNIWKGHPIYNEKNGKLRLPETKADIEHYFKVKVVALSVFLLDIETKKDDW